MSDLLYGLTVLLLFCITLALPVLFWLWPDGPPRRRGEHD